MSECRALTNLIGNGVACAISRSEGELDRDKLQETKALPIEIGKTLEPGAIQAVLKADQIGRAR